MTQIPTYAQAIARLKAGGCPHAVGITVTDRADLARVIVSRGRCTRCDCEFLRILDLGYAEPRMHLVKLAGPRNFL